MRKHTTKSISFFMELMIVLCFFTISASICVMVMSNANEKSREADDRKKALLYGQNIIEQQCSVLLSDTFQMDANGNIVREGGVYNAEVKVVKENTVHAIANLHITRDQKEVSVLAFHRGEELSNVCQ